MRYCLTMGDPSGVGPELTLKAFQEGGLSGEFAVVGDVKILRACNEALGFGVPVRKMEARDDIEPGCVNVIDLGLLSATDVEVGKVCRASGNAALRYVEAATRLALEGTYEAIVTLPMNKEAARLSDPGFSGHTELIAGICGTKRYAMMLASERLTVVHVSTHVSLAEAVRRVRADRIQEVISLAWETLRRFIETPRIAVAGLNPHAGEHGAFGSEEEREIMPAVLRAKMDGMDVSGPEAPDTVFLKASQGRYDAVVCMYHDQGHIPLKILDFEAGVNVTIGLPIVRTSVDHGTAFDIAWKGIASTRSLIAAVSYAEKLAGQGIRATPRISGPGPGR
jgi:4-phospho-D-threonate 3-dehydrogenase / 4-phospho-D-erythronate 3-dehydrogenase